MVSQQENMLASSAISYFIVQGITARAVVHAMQRTVETQKARVREELRRTLVLNDLKYALNQRSHLMHQYKSFVIDDADIKLRLVQQLEVLKHFYCLYHNPV
ncbi:MAG: hypothetical protein JHC93_02560 [Parachlamydiales bacterium]|nr:hypothetical protein [Parachlamydiales bacterium]